MKVLIRDTLTASVYSPTHTMDFPFHMVVSKPNSLDGLNSRICNFFPVSSLQKLLQLRKMSKDLRVRAITGTFSLKTSIL